MEVCNPVSCDTACVAALSTKERSPWSAASTAKGQDVGTEPEDGPAGGKRARGLGNIPGAPPTKQLPFTFHQAVGHRSFAATIARLGAHHSSKGWHLQLDVPDIEEAFRIRRHEIEGGLIPERFP